ncbi:hypothetical protein F3J22_23400 [Chitinophaga sp. Cy-1792]|nr:hypothetical protein [Chitinophaga sp. Cy-1792]
MKKILCLCVLAGFISKAEAQKVNLDRYVYNFSYKDLPKHPLGQEYQTYSISGLISPGVKNNFGDHGVEEAINVEGLKRVDGFAHIMVNISVGDFMIESNDINERVVVNKDKDGKETSRSYYYSVTVAYSWEASWSVKDYKGKTLVNSVLRSRGDRSTWTSQEYGSRSDARDYYKNNYAEIKGQLIRKEVNTHIAAISRVTSSEYGFPVKKEVDFLWIMDSKKHPEQDAQQAAVKSFRNVITSVSPEEFPESTKDTLKTLITYFDGIPKKYPTDDKADRKLRYGSYYNKAKIYLYLDNPEAAIKEAEALIANDYDGGDGKRLIKEAEELREALKNNNVIARHFEDKTRNAVPPVKG